MVVAECAYSVCPVALARPPRGPVGVVSAEIEGADPCPTCGRKLDGVTSINRPNEPVAPTAGDVTVCAYCGAVLRFTAALGFETVSDDEVATFDPDTRWQLALARNACARLRESRKGPMP